MHTNLPCCGLDTDTLVGALMTEARSVGAHPVRFSSGPWVGVVADETWLAELGYDTDPWGRQARPGDELTPRVVPYLADHAERVSVLTRAFSFHNPPLHNGCPPPPQVNSRRAVVAFVPRRRCCGRRRG